jgi:predicted amidohydrolase
MKIAVAQTRQSDNFDDNTAAALEALEIAHQKGAKICCLPVS